MHCPIEDGDRVVKESHVMMCPEEYIAKKINFLAC